MGTILGLIILYEVIKPKSLKVRLSLKIDAGKSSNDHEPDD